MEGCPLGLERYRLVTRSDFDGLVCAVLLQQLGLVEDLVFVHPKDVQDAQVEIGPGDITTNLPYAPGAQLVFDHHHSETLRNSTIAPNHVIDPDAPSAARVVYDHYGGPDRFPNISPELMRAVDQADSRAPCTRSAWYRRTCAGAISGRTPWASRSSTAPPAPTSARSCCPTAAGSQRGDLPDPPRRRPRGRGARRSPERHQGGDSLAPILARPSEPLTTAQSCLPHSGSGTRLGEMDRAPELRPPEMRGLSMCTMRCYRPGLADAPVDAQTADSLTRRLASPAGRARPGRSGPDSCRCHARQGR
jgi:hypothetical protein